MTLEHIFILWVIVTLYLSVVFFYEMWRYRNGDYEIPKAVQAEEPREAPAPRKDPPKTFTGAEQPQRSPPAAPSASVVERHEELMDWLTDHKKRDSAAADLAPTR
ncbi:hypothetical protein HNQ60_003925 [Povalibacter uvarum]|uniref:Uncharacterized protein n=1 Tax=Povalibacter uvarum TaxID=732238 RepID=A0A841HSN5_9GAMM|nr:hypothetical protein [Povalibacter uvarum]MBB6095038.1 hypothetical protein [Povalibacter uvarum]